MMDVHSLMSQFGVVGGISIVTSVLAIFMVVRRRNTNSDLRTPNAPRNVVLFHQVGRGPYAPSLSPFIVKLETYLRIAKIPYKNIHDKKRGPKGKVPWIEYNGLVLPDSQLIIEYLNKVRKVDLNQSLSVTELATSRAFQKMVDEHTYWIMVLMRWRYDDVKEVIKLAKWRRLSMIIATYFAKRQTHAQGIGRHNREEIIHILDGDFKALSDFLGEKKFFFGDEPTEVDCAIFGQLSQFLWHLPHTPCPQIIQDKYINLLHYCERMKTTFWPDWQSSVTHGTKSVQSH